jgi:hypothetical protein
MDYTEIINSIGSVGFPIVACVGIFYLYNTTIKEIVNALSNVTLVLSDVKNTLSKIDDKLDGVNVNE